ncbi:MAG: hypothetical protein VX589_14355 [Myxococcota bacterium]|nr:hypothetical protein [Myxococcota bacterium]
MAAFKKTMTLWRTLRHVAGPAYTLLVWSIIGLLSAGWFAGF